jgi:hypothetical protein
MDVDGADSTRMRFRFRGKALNAARSPESAEIS